MTSSEALSHKYVGFEDQFRGAPEEIAARLAGYVEIFAGASDVLDIGCGRGEFLALLQARGVRARGIDVNESMVEVCVQKGLDASKADALEYLRAQPPGSLGGLLAAQVVEHLDPSYLTSLLDAAYAALRPGAPIVLETINPACWFAFFESYVRDITHVRPLHPDTLKFLLQASGFSGVEIRYQAPYPEHDKLQRVAPAALGGAGETLNANVDKLNSLLFTYLDYAAVATAGVAAGSARPGPTTQPRCSRPVEAATAPPGIAWRSRSASTIIVTSCSKLTSGDHPSFALAFEASPISRSTSAGRRKRGSVRTYFCQSSPAWLNAVSTRCFTECVTPVAIT